MMSEPSVDYIYQPTDIVLAKVKGFSAWPAMIVPDELIPDHILKTRTHSTTGEVEPAEVAKELDTTNEDDTFDENIDPEKYIIYSKMLKFKKNEKLRHQYCVKFFCDDSYIWVKPTDIQLLSKEACQEWLDSSKRKNKKLIPAYEMASRGIEGIDIWEFIEYGSYGKDDDEEEYIEEDESIQPRKRTRGAVKKEPTRSSMRQRGKRKLEEEESEGDEKPTRLRNTRSKGKSTIKKEPVQRRTRRSAPVKEEEEEEEEDVEDEFSEEEHPVKRTNTKSKGPKRTTAKGKSKTKTKAKPKPQIIKYEYEDDEDWSLVGLGPQDLTIHLAVNPLVNRLTQKKNVERHLDQKLNILDKIAGINKLLTTLILPENPDSKITIGKDDYDLLLDEMDQALSMKGAKREFLIIFQSSTELLLNMRILLNIRRDELLKWKLWDQFQAFFELVFQHELIEDEQGWTFEQVSDDGDKDNSTNKIPTGSIDVDKKEPEIEMASVDEVK
ncbi:hypothetical protein NCAS_0A12980 [Naumovozyma castellii]|uniref:PWWP domain-containing protein n=1 Tax=Naumovozyma castellii TaxID=27288 RepID=G0V8Q7_NAUCA|nr:hypothetical protein NCAS_0A12980 [Naumovozyma castellii CBS 4309]CCC67856.1 hypothetical protein NCAS_0A12980 [Naumovozyma castellii CBS 4309]